MIKNQNFHKRKCSPCSGNTPKLNKDGELIGVNWPTKPE